MTASSQGMKQPMNTRSASRPHTITCGCTRDVNHLPPRKGVQHICGLAKTRSVPTPTGLEELQSMTKEELINALVMAKITEARLKKLSGGRSWCAQEVHSYRQEEYQVVMELSGQSPYSAKESTSKALWSVL